MCYMMSKQGYASDTAEHWPLHLMFFLFADRPCNLGAGLPGSPILVMRDTPEHLTRFAIGVQR